MTTSQPTPASDMEFMSGSWVCQLGERTVEERWERPIGGSLQGTARHIVDGKVVFMEFFAIEEIEGKTSLYIHVGKFSESEGEIEEFELASISDGRVAFRRDVNDFPDEIVYEKTDEGMKAILSGKRDGKPDSFELEFSRSKERS